MNWKDLKVTVVILFDENFYMDSLAENASKKKKLTETPARELALAQLLQVYVIN